MRNNIIHQITLLFNDLFCNELVFYVDEKIAVKLSNGLRLLLKEKKEVLQKRENFANIFPDINCIYRILKMKVKSI